MTESGIQLKKRLNMRIYHFQLCYYLYFVYHYIFNQIRRKIVIIYFLSMTFSLIILVHYSIDFVFKNSFYKTTCKFSDIVNYPEYNNIFYQPGYVILEGHSRILLEDKFEDIEKALSELETLENIKINSDDKNSMFIMVKSNSSEYETSTPNRQFHMKITTKELYSENDPNIENLLHSMATQPIIKIEEMKSGTQFKLLVTFENGDNAIFKPMRYSRQTVTFPNQFYFTDFERHNAEIAAFQLDRILKFHRVPPAVGRIINIAKEFFPLADEQLLSTFFVSPDNNVCFHGHCKQYCDTSHAICGNPYNIEGSLIALLPNNVSRLQIINPWKRSYHKRKKMAWEKQQNYCSLIKKLPYYSTERLEYLIDMSIFDFLMGNADRHHYEIFEGFDNIYPIHLDNGRGFGNPFKDELILLAILRQCCITRKSTLRRLLSLHRGPLHLGGILKKQMEKDPLNPVLWEPYFYAMNIRVGKILQEVRKCLKQKTASEVIIISSKK